MSSAAYPFKKSQTWALLFHKNTKEKKSFHKDKTAHCVKEIIYNNATAQIMIVVS